MPDMSAPSALSPFRSRQSQSQRGDQEYTRLPGSSSSSSSSGSAHDSALSLLLPPFSSSASPSRRASTASTSSSSPGYAYPSGSSSSLTSSSTTTTSSRRRTATTFVLAFGLGALFVYAVSPPAPSDYHLDDRLAGLAAPISKLVFHPYAAAPTSAAAALSASTATPVSPPSKGKQAIEEPASCNPFKVPGQLEHVVGEVDQNLWRPWDPSCAPSTLLTSLRNGEDLPWLRNRTVAIIGDSIDRDHIEYFCELARGDMEWVWEGTKHDPGYSYSPGDPAHYNSSGNEQSGESGGAVQSRPRICHVAAYDLTLVFAFHYGLGDGTDRERQFPHFYPPFRFQDRLSHILVPLLRQQERYPPDLVEVGSGAWDLQHWTLEDREADADRMLALSKERTDWYRTRFTSALQVVEDTFPASRSATSSETGGLQAVQSDAQPPSLPTSGMARLTRRYRSNSDVQKETALFFREMQHTKLTDSVPPSRVHGLRRLQELLLQTEHRETGGKWQLNNIGQLLLGMEHHYRDAVHPNLYPAGKLWGDMMLYNLKQHVESSESYRKLKRTPPPHAR